MHTERASLTVGDLALIDSNVAGHAGGAFAVEDATAIVNLGATVTITNNTAVTGGAIVGTLGANIVLGASARLSSNVATSGRGRAVSLTNASLSIGATATVLSNGGAADSSVLDVDADSYLRMGRVRTDLCHCMLDGRSVLELRSADETSHHNTFRYLQDSTISNAPSFDLQVAPGGDSLCETGYELNYYHCKDAGGCPGTNYTQPTGQLACTLGSATAFPTVAPTSVSAAS